MIYFYFGGKGDTVYLTAVFFPDHTNSNNLTGLCSLLSDIDPQQCLFTPLEATSVALCFLLNLSNSVNLSFINGRKKRREKNQ